MMRTLRIMLGMRVVTDDGEELGRVVDLVCTHRQQRGQLRVGGVAFGKHGWLERMGLREHDAFVVQCKEVSRIERDQLVVHRGRYLKQR